MPSQDKGTASAQLIDLGANISFEIVVDTDGNLTIDNVKAEINIGALNVQVMAVCLPPLSSCCWC